MFQHAQQSADEHSEAAGPCQVAGILLGSSCIGHEASGSNLFQSFLLPHFLGGALLQKRNGRAGPTSAPIGAAGVAGQPATSVAQF